ncbi:MAG TPA: MarR family transcriptional regulator [Actinomycetota bacterium]|jgi:DNA-binding MarR family transcriptional regulator|nr:MarR family transcriptional regulator [Actinomycetota bacterium]
MTSELDPAATDLAEPAPEMGECRFPDEADRVGDDACGAPAAAATLPNVPAERLSDGELRAWQAFLRSHRSVTGTLDAELTREQQLPLGSYEVLLLLSWAPEHALRMSDIAERALLSRSGMTRLVDRLESEGLVERRTCKSDGRGVYAVLTDAGYERLRTASRTHLRGVRDHFTSRLSSDDLDELSRILAKLLPA